MKAIEKYLPLLKGAMEQAEKNGYMYFENEGVTIFANDNYVSVKINVANDVNVEKVVIRADGCENEKN
jgi:hypothetical protein